MAETSAPRTRDTSGTLDQFDTYGTANGALQQAVVLGDGQSNNKTVGVEPWGALDTFTGWGTLFYDTFAGSLDTTDKWVVQGTAPTLSVGTMTMSTTASTYNALYTRDSVRANGGYTYVANGISIETTTTTGAGRFWGLGTVATTPAASVLAQNGIGFELDQASGSLLAVTYTAGARTTVATLTRPTDGAIHRYALIFRVTAAYWFIDNMQVPVASASFPNVTTPELPALIVRQNAASFTGTPVFSNTAHLTADSERRLQVISDPVVGTRQLRVDMSGAAATAPHRGVITRSALVAPVTSTTVLQANAQRAGFRVDNSLGVTDVLLGEDGSAVTATSWTLRVAAGAQYESPDGYVSTSLITWAGFNGTALTAGTAGRPTMVVEF